MYKTFSTNHLVLNNVVVESATLPALRDHVFGVLICFRTWHAFVSNILFYLYSTYSKNWGPYIKYVGGQGGGGGRGCRIFVGP